jgi:hypothetical protein
MGHFANEKTSLHGRIAGSDRFCPLWTGIALPPAIAEIAGAGSPHDVRVTPHLPAVCIAGQSSSGIVFAASARRMARLFPGSGISAASGVPAVSRDCISGGAQLRTRRTLVVVTIVLAHFVGRAGQKEM